MGVLPDPDESSNSIIRYIPFVYTIGNYECGLPELLLFGPAYRTLNAITARMRDNGRAFADGEAIDLGGRCKPKAFWANEEDGNIQFKSENITAPMTTTFSKLSFLIPPAGIRAIHNVISHFVGHRCSETTGGIDGVV
jgi:hypothetical protein